MTHSRIKRNNDQDHINKEKLTTNSTYLEVFQKVHSNFLVVVTEIELYSMYIFLVNT